MNLVGFDKGGKNGNESLLYTQEDYLFLGR